MKLKTNRSQYNGTTKNSFCTRCEKDMNNKTREEQDQHVIECLKQEKLF